MNELTMLTRLNRFVKLAQEMGFEVRQELLDGQGAAVCRIKGKPCLFLDLTSGPADQLAAIKTVLRVGDESKE